MFSLKQLVICATWVLALVGISLIGASSPDGEDKSPEDAAPVTTHDDLAAQADVEVATARAAESASSRYPRYTTYPPDALPIEKWLYEMLDKPVSLAYPGPNVPLKDILRDIENQMSEAYGKQDDGAQFRMVFRPDYGELELDFNPEDPLDDVQIYHLIVENMTLRNALALIFEQTTDPLKLDCVVTNESMVITSSTKAEESDAFVSTRVYPAEHLLNLNYGRFDPDAARRNHSRNRMWSWGRGIGGGIRTVDDGDISGSGDATEYDEMPSPPSNDDVASVNRRDRTLADVVIGMTSPPCLWGENGADLGEVHIAENNLIVRQTPVGHYEIVKLLTQLTAAMENQ